MIGSCQESEWSEDEQAEHTFKTEKKKPIVDAVMSGYTSKPIGCPLPTVALM